jgi:hypothetical protein
MANETAKRGSGKWWVVGLGVVVLTGTLVFIFLATRYRVGPALTPGRLEEAKQRWQRAAIQDYDIDIKVSGRTSASYSVQVRQGEITTALQNGKPFQNDKGQLDKSRAYFWTVPGLFEVMETELANAAKPDAPECFTAVDFDLQDGHPRRFLRSSSGQSTLIEVALKRTP